MTVTQEMVADRLKGYLLGRWTLEEIVSWAEDAMAEAKFEDSNFTIVRDIVAQLGLGDVAAFGLAWEDVRKMLERLGYRPKVEFEPIV